MPTIHPGTPVIAYCLLDGEGEVVAQRHSGERFYAASTIKLAVMLAAAIEIDAGRLGFDEPLACRHSFASAVADAPAFSMVPDDVDPEFPADGESATVAQLIGMMITRSSNEATNVLVDRIGLDAVGAALALSGATDSGMHRLIGDAAADAAGLTNLVTAADLARTMRYVATGRLTSPETTAFMREALAGQQHRRIALELPVGTTWGSKSGDVAAICHDVAYFAEPGRSEERYLAVCTRSFGDEQGTETIRAIASSLLFAPGAA